MIELFLEKMFPIEMFRGSSSSSKARGDLFFLFPGDEK